MLRLTQTSKAQSAATKLPPSPVELRKSLDEAVHYMEVRRCLDRIFERETPIKTILVTSLSAGEGKTVFSLSAAWSLAERTGRKVLLVDATNFDRATSVSMDEVCGLEREKALVVESTKAGPSSISYAWLPPQKSGISSVKAQLQKISEGFDVVIIDAVALNVSSRMETDPLELASLSDGLLLVRSENRLAPDVSNNLMSTLRSRNLNILGVVSNASGGES